MKKLYSFIALAMLTMSANAQVTYDFRTVAANDGVIVNPKYGEGNDTDSELAFSVYSKSKAAEFPMITLVAPDGTDYDKRFGIQNRSKSWVFRNTKDGVWRGLYSQYDRFLVIKNINPGDQLSFLLSPQDDEKAIVFDNKDLEEEGVGRIPCISRANLNAKLVEFYGGDEEYIKNGKATVEERDAKSEEFRTVNVQVYTKATSEELAAGLLLLPETGIYIEKITITPAGGPDTGIKDVKTAEKNSGKYYNLNGVEVAQPVKGVYIRDGKKVIVK